MAELYEPRLATYLYETTGYLTHSPPLANSRQRPDRMNPAKTMSFRDGSLPHPSMASENVPTEMQMSFLDRSDAWNRRRELHRAQLMQRASIDERKECVFYPTITVKAKRLLNAPFPLAGDRPKSGSQAAGRRLSADAVRRKTKLVALKADAEKRKAVKEFQECTFQPRLTPYHHPPAYQPHEHEDAWLSRVDRFESPRVVRPKTQYDSLRRSSAPLRQQADSGSLSKADTRQGAASAKLVLTQEDSHGYLASSFVERLALYEQRREDRLRKNREEAARPFTTPEISPVSKRLLLDARPFQERLESSLEKRDAKLKVLALELLKERGLISDGPRLPQRRGGTAETKHQLNVLRERVEAEARKNITLKPNLNDPRIESRLEDLAANEYGRKMRELQQERERMAQDIRKQRAEDELEESTFQPNVRSRQPRVNISIRG